MAPYIKFNGVRSDALGLRLVSAEPFILPKRTRQREYIPGRLGSISSADFEMPAVGYRIRLAAMDADKSAVVSKMHSIASWALSARMMTVWHEPGYYYTGAVEGDSSFSMLSRRNGMIEIEFICDPPCRQHVLKTGDAWFPSVIYPIPEQISSTINTASATNKTAAFVLPAGAFNSPLLPALHLSLTGTWTTLILGGTLTITEAKGSATTLYIDCEAQEVYRIVTGTRTPVKYSGDFPVLAANGDMAITGTGFNLTAARLLVIERG
jgi:phage-related protein